MNIVLQNDLDNTKFFNELLEDETLTDEQRNELIKAKVESELQAVPKVEAMGYYVFMADGELALLKERIKQLEWRAIRRKQSIEYIKNTITLYMKEKGIDKIEGTTFSFKLSKCPASVEITNESILPDKYKRTTVITDYPKDLIKEDLKAGIDIPGAELITDKKRLVIK